MPLEVPLLLFTGEPGIGKTRLLQEAQRRARRAARLSLVILEREHNLYALAIFRRLGDRLHARAVEIRLRDLAPGD